jgi:hypothetical protein
MTEQNIAITYSIQEIESLDTNETNILKINNLINEINSKTINDELFIPQTINYHYNYTMKELFLICDYYGFSKKIKTSKLNKEQIIEIIVDFELNPENSEIVCKRQNMWFYMNELKSDKFMKKFVLW